ncbi:hypothetical protein RGD00_03650 [Xinfangfangia sp. LG-4]|nr:hypothetical protein [Xinfangfangia sp. LG-4]MDR5651685.1 hypothetical protein [Xinfangfangia sp. LG-4]
MTDFIRIRNPRGELAAHGARVYPTLNSLEGKRMVVLNNHWTCMDEIADHIGAALRARHGVAEVLTFSVPVGTAAEEAVIAEAASKADFALVGLAN